MKTTLRMSVMLLTIAMSGLISVSHSRNNDERQQIIEHLHSIFNAFVHQDLETLRATHSDDWTGFKAGSREIVKGIDGYMENITFKNVVMLEYEIEDIEIKFYDNVAVVYYIAQWKNRLKGPGQRMSIRARAVDIYVKKGNQWIQTGSNLNYLPTPGFRAPGMEKFYDVSFDSDVK